MSPLITPAVAGPVEVSFHIIARTAPAAVLARGNFLRYLT